MNFTDSFQDFSSKLNSTDLALYAGVGLVLWVLFKNKLSPVQSFLNTTINKVKELLSNSTNLKPVEISKPVINKNNKEEDIFFRLVVSWKQTRDLAEASGCKKAVEVADQMFPYISPMVCVKEEKTNE